MIFFPNDIQTSHSLGIVTDDGAELLNHVCMNTVKLNGEGFTPKKNREKQ